MDEAKLQAIRTELKSVKALFASLERDQIVLEERIAVADRSQRRIGYYLCGLFILCLYPFSLHLDPLMVSIAR